MLLYKEIGYKNRKKKFSLGSELKNIISTKGMCPFCFSLLYDENTNGYIGKNLSFTTSDKKSFVTTICNSCYKKNQDTHGDDIKKYFDSIGEIYQIVWKNIREKGVMSE